jgi:hypothetical protein
MDIDADPVLPSPQTNPKTTAPHPSPSPGGVVRKTRKQENENGRVLTHHLSSEYQAPVQKRLSLDDHMNLRLHHLQVGRDLLSSRSQTMWDHARLRVLRHIRVRYLARAQRALKVQRRVPCLLCHLHRTCETTVSLHSKWQRREMRWQGRGLQIGEEVFLLDVWFGHLGRVELKSEPLEEGGEPDAAQGLAHRIRL